MDTKRYNGKIYAIRSFQTDKIYIGSTTEKRLSARLGKHREKFKTFNQGKYHYVSSFELMKYDDAYIELIEQVEDATKEEIRRLEGTHIRANVCVNKLIAGRTKSECDKVYYESNQEKIKEYHKNWYEENKEKQRENCRERYASTKERLKEKLTCECGCIVSRQHMSRHKKDSCKLNK